MGTGWVWGSKVYEKAQYGVYKARHMRRGCYHVLVSHEERMLSCPSVTPLHTACRGCSAFSMVSFFICPFSSSALLCPRCWPWRNGFGAALGLGPRLTLWTGRWRHRRSSAGPIGTWHVGTALHIGCVVRPC